MTDRDPDRPRLAATYAEHIALDLGQVEIDYPWNVPDGAGTTVTETKVSDGESLNPPKVQVHVYSGMLFRREEDGAWFEFDGATFWGFRDERGTEPNPEVVLKHAADPEADRLELSGKEFARRIRQKELLPESAVASYEERGVL
jgi:hypothetical protein